MSNMSANGNMFHRVPPGRRSLSFSVEEACVVVEGSGPLRTDFRFLAGERLG